MAKRTSGKTPIASAKPWQGKVYAMGKGFNPASEDFASAPKQVRGMMRHIAEKKLRGRGKELCESAIKAGAVKSKIKPDILFAYYARKMESLGLELVKIEPVKARIETQK